MEKETNVAQEETVVTPGAEKETENNSTWTLESLTKELEKTRKEAASTRVKLRKFEEEAAKKVEEEALKNGEVTKLYEQTKTELNKTRQEVEEYRQLQQEEFDSIVSSFSDDDKSLIPENISLTEKLRLAKKLNAKFNSIERTPERTPGVITPSSKSKSAYGGHADKLEWAEKDPEGLLKEVQLRGLHF